MIRSILAGLAAPRTKIIFAALGALIAAGTVYDCSSARRKAEEARREVAVLRANAELARFLEGVWADTGDFLAASAKRQAAEAEDIKRRVRDEIEAGTDWGRCAGVPEPDWLCPHGLSGCPDADA